MTDLQRLFRQLVRNLAATDSARLHRALPLTDIRGSIVPYRANRRALQLESSEDYELVLLQLCAGEGGFARTEPEEVRELFAAELRSANPDLGILQQHEHAVVSLEANPLAEALDPEPDLAFAPPEQRSGPPAQEEPATLPELAHFEPLQTESAGAPDNELMIPHCSQCGGLLPSRRVVNFCPHCGGSQVLTRCPTCQGELEPGWRHCVSCGTAVSG